MNANEKQKLRDLSAALDIIRDTRESMPVRQALAFLSVALHESGEKFATLEDVGADTDSSSAVVSRDLLGLGLRMRSRKPGLNLVKSFSDYNDLRRKPYRLTAKGKRLMAKIMEVL